MPKTIMTLMQKIETVRKALIGRKLLAVLDNKDMPEIVPHVTSKGTWLYAYKGYGSIAYLDICGANGKRHTVAVCLDEQGFVEALDSGAVISEAELAALLAGLDVDCED